MFSEYWNRSSEKCSNVKTKTTQSILARDIFDTCNKILWLIEAEKNFLSI